MPELVRSEQNQVKANTPPFKLENGLDEFLQVRSKRNLAAPKKALAHGQPCEPYRGLYRELL